MRAVSSILLLIFLLGCQPERSERLPDKPSPSSNSGEKHVDTKEMKDTKGPDNLVDQKENQEMTNNAQKKEVAAVLNSILRKRPDQRLADIKKLLIKYPDNKKLLTHHAVALENLMLFCKAVEAWKKAGRADKAEYLNSRYCQ